MITVVDDDPSVRKALGRLIVASGYDAVSYESAEAFLAADVVGQTDCLILDVHLPGMSGLELQAELVDSGVKCPIVFISAFDEDRPCRRALSAGAIEFLHKPIDNDRLIALIERTVGEA